MTLLVAVLFAVYYVVPILLIFSLCATTLHTWEEVRGYGSPFWEYAEDFTGVRVGSVTGHVLFYSLAAFLMVAAVMGYAYQSPTWLSLLIGIRIGDAVFSHLMLYHIYRKPNPGLNTAFLYCTESFFALTLWDEFMPAGAKVSELWLCVGVGAFGGFWNLCSFGYAWRRIKADRK